MPPSAVPVSICQRPAELLQHLICFDTTNPPGNEAGCIHFLDDLLQQVGIQRYGYLPMRLPEDFNFSGTIHAADERIPVKALDFGAQAIYQALQKFGP
jgi:acetylornithine deacetylase/succinyl-diaminopimelate desuccinylase-like protein